MTAQLFLIGIRVPDLLSGKSNSWFGGVATYSIRLLIGQILVIEAPLLWLSTVRSSVDLHEDYLLQANQEHKQEQRRTNSIAENLELSIRSWGLTKRWTAVVHWQIESKQNLNPNLGDLLNIKCLGACKTTERFLNGLQHDTRAKSPKMVTQHPDIIWMCTFFNDSGWLKVGPMPLESVSSHLSMYM